MKAGTTLIWRSTGSKNWRSIFCIALSVLFVTAQLTGCAANKLAEYPPGATAGKHKNTAAVKELSITVQAMTDRQEQEKYFGKDLTKDGVLPVYIMAENRHPVNSYLLNKDLISLKSSKTTTALPRAFSVDIADPAPGRTLGTIGLITFICAPIVSIPISLTMVFYGGKMSTDAFISRYGALSQSLYSHTLSPGAKVEGFVFFKLPDDQTNSRDYNLALQLPELGTKTTHDINLPL